MFDSARNIDEAIDEVVRWAGALPGDFAAGVTTYDEATVIAVHGTLMPSRLAVRARLAVRNDLTVERYRFHLQQEEGSLVWRHDRHPGHEYEPGMRGLAHLHRGGSEGERLVPDDGVDLARIADELVRANLENSE